MNSVRTTCAYCGVGCGIVATKTGARSATISGDAAHPANHGKLCSKGTHLGETIGLEGRLLSPLIGEREAGWDEALHLVARRFADTIAEHGPDSVAFYVSGQLLTEDYYVANKLMKGFIGSANIDTNSRLCMASAVAAHNRAFGEDVVPACYEDLDEADLILLVGSNTAWCHPVIWQRIEAARAARGTKLVVIDPRRTETAEGADLHIGLRAGSDIALFTGLLAHMLPTLDRAEVEQQCQVPADYWASLEGITAATTAAACDVPLADIEALFSLFAATPRTVTAFSMGVNQSTSGTDKASAIISLHLATGRIGVPGAAPFSITGQPNAMGGREVGGLASTLAAHMGFEPENVDRIARFWNAPNTARKPGLKAVDLFEAVHDGRIKALWVMATNPAVSMPNAGRVREALAACPFVVVSDVIADTDTGRFAHVRLPALGWGEKDGTMTNSERMISRQRSFLAPPGEAKPDWWIVAEVAKRMGFAASFEFPAPAAIFREHAALTAFENDGARRLDLGELARLSDAGYGAIGPYRWGGDRIALEPGEARMTTVHQPALADGMTLNTGRYRDQWHTMTRTGLSARLSQHRREPMVEVHPLDAEKVGLEAGDLAQVTSAQGDALFKVALSDGQRRGELFVPMHWTDRTGRGGRANLLPDSRVDPVSGQPGFKLTAASLAKVETEWRAFLVTRTVPADLDALWWTRIKVEGGWLVEIAGNGPTAALETLLPSGDRVEALDCARGAKRIVVSSDDRLEAALFVTRDGRLPSRDWLIAQLVEPGDGAPIRYLAARPPGIQVDQGETVCACFNIGEKRIRTAIAADGLASVEAIGVSLGAGTNCGSCRPALARLLAQMDLSNAA
ncbi:MAG: molybdopterin-dependent oxidoreductase [Sphingomicrobium sp.]